MITSVRNERIRFIRSLGEPAARRKTGCTVLEGTRLVREALKSGARFVLVAFDERISRSAEGRSVLDSLRAAGVDTLEVSPAVLDSASSLESPQGIVAVVRIPRSDPDEAMRGLTASPAGGQQPLVALADGVQDPGNVGTIIRSADAFGAAMAVLVNGCADPFNPKVLRASMGSVFHVECPVFPVGGDAARALADLGFAIYYGEARSSTPVHAVDLTGRVVIAVGSEAAGVSGAVRAHGSPVCVPMVERLDSLNAAMAMTAMLYEAQRQRTLAL